MLGWLRKGSSGAGMVRADAYVVDARLTGGEAVGNRVVEMTLDVRPKDGMPFQITRKFVRGVPHRIETGQKLPVHYDPLDPSKLELA